MPLRLRLVTTSRLVFPYSATPAGVDRLYTPAGKMDLFFDDPTGPQPGHPTLEDRKAEFERHGVTLLGPPLTRKEIDETN